MYTLTIAQIFSQIEFYQENYLNILNTPESYFTEVEGAFVELFPFKKQNLFLGDLLQLWFAEKWLVEQSYQFQFEVFLNKQSSEETSKDLFVYAITGNLITGENQSKAWNSSTCSKNKVYLRSSFRHYCEFKALTRPKEIPFLFKPSKNIAF